MFIQTVCFIPYCVLCTWP